MLILAGFIIGTFGTLTGAGSGFVLVPLLLLTRHDMSPEVITGILIAVVSANAISGSVTYARVRRIDYKAGLLFDAFTVPGLVAGVFVTKYIPLQWFNKVFGVLLLAIAIYLLVKKNKDMPLPQGGRGSSGLPLHLTDAQDTFTYRFSHRASASASVIVNPQ